MFQGVFFSYFALKFELFYSNYYLGQVKLQFPVIPTKKITLRSQNLSIALFALGKFIKILKASHSNTLGADSNFSFSHRLTSHFNTNTHQVNSTLFKSKDTLECTFSQGRSHLKILVLNSKSEKSTKKSEQLQRKLPLPEDFCVPWQLDNQASMTVQIHHQNSFSCYYFLQAKIFQRSCHSQRDERKILDWSVVSHELDHQ